MAKNHGKFSNHQHKGHEVPKQPGGNSRLQDHMPFWMAVDIAVVSQTVDGQPWPVLVRPAHPCEIQENELEARPEEVQVQFHNMAPELPGNYFYYEYFHVAGGQLLGHRFISEHGDHIVNKAWFCANHTTTGVVPDLELLDHACFTESPANKKKLLHLVNWLVNRANDQQLIKGEVK